MKKFISGILVGILISITGAVFAEDGLEKVEAYLRPSLPVTLDGKPVKLENPPIMYDGATHLRLRDLAKLTGLYVNWNDKTQTVELSTTPFPSEEAKGSVTDSTYKNYNATDPEAYKKDPTYIRGQKIVELQKKLRSMDDELNELGTPVNKHNRDKMFDPSIKDTEADLQAKKAFEDKQAEYKSVDVELQRLLKEQEDATTGVIIKD